MWVMLGTGSSQLQLYRGVCLPSLCAGRGPAMCLCASALCVSPVNLCGVPGVLRDLVNKFCCFFCCNCRLQRSVPVPADPAKNCLNGRLWWGEARSHCRDRTGLAALWPLLLVIPAPTKRPVFPWACLEPVSSSRTSGSWGLSPLFFFFNHLKIQYSVPLHTHTPSAVNLGQATVQRAGRKLDLRNRK